MEKESVRAVRIDEGFDERWAAWQARGDQHDLETRRRLFLLLGALVLSGAVLSGLWLI